MKTTLRTPAVARLSAAASAAALSVALLAGCTGSDDAVEPDDVATEQADGAEDSAAELIEDADGEVVGITYPGEDGATALDLLLRHDPSAEYSGEAETAFVTGIAGRSAVDGEEFWAFFVDGDFAMEGAGSYETSDGEVIEWQLEEIE